VLFVVRLTTPVKPLTAVMVMLAVPAELTSTLTLNGLALIVKSWTTNVTIAECESEPLVPVTDTRLFPDEVKVQDSVEVPEPVTLAGETLQNAVVFVTRLTTPAKPFTGVMVIVDEPSAFTLTLTLDGFAVTV
jgi:hypothetical protein